MTQSYLLWVASSAVGLGIVALYNIHGYYTRKKELQQIAREEGIPKAIDDIQVWNEFEAENLDYKVVNLTHGIGEKLANRRFLAGQL